MKLIKWGIGAVVAALSMTTSTAALAATFVVNYTGTSFGTTLPFATVLTLDVASSGSVATLISGTRNGVAITALSSYAAADNRLSFANPFVTLGGLSFTVAGGTAYNFYSTAGVYYELNSITDPGGNNQATASAVNFASVNGIVLTVPEVGTWGMMIAGAGVLGAALRRRRKVTTRVSFA